MHLLKSDKCVPAQFQFKMALQMNLKFSSFCQSSFALEIDLKGRTREHVSLIAE